jgi:hypothetical protein
VHLLFRKPKRQELHRPSALVPRTNSHTSSPFLLFHQHENQLSAAMRHIPIIMAKHTFVESMLPEITIRPVPE